MKYHVSLSGRTHEVEVRGERVLIDGASVAAQLVAIPGTPLRRITIDDVAHTFAILPNHAGWTIELAGTHWAVEVVDERTRQLQELTGGPAGGRAAGAIKAPMPGLVLEVEVEEGQQLEPGQGVVVLEAMKMENEITAHTGGVVTAIHVTQGQTVEKGAPLVDLAEA